MTKLMSRHETYVFLAIVLFSIIITAVNPSFLTLENFFDVLKSYSFMGILAVGVLIVLLSGGIDISFTAVATVAVYVTALTVIKPGGNIVVAFLVASVIGTLLGLVNAAVIYFFNIPSIITTIATLNIYYGILTVVSRGRWIYTLPQWFRAFAEIKVLVLTNAEGVKYGVSVVTLIWLAVVIVAWVILRYTLLGRGIYAMGGSLPSARRAGFDVLGTQMFVYAFLGLLAGIAGVVQALQAAMVAPNALVGKELDVIAAVVLGGASLSGGAGTMVGTLLGVALIAIMSNGLTLMRVSSFWYNVFIGLIILVSVGASAYRRKRQEKRMIAVEVE
jgi:simple sugar transport system permease protein